MESQSFSELGGKERESYNKGLERKGYDGFFSHCKVFYAQRRARLVKEHMQFAEDKKVLEIGSSTWRGWLENNSIRPSHTNTMYHNQILLSCFAKCGITEPYDFADAAHVIPVNPWNPICYNETDDLQNICKVGTSEMQNEHAIIFVSSSDF